MCWVWTQEQNLIKTQISVSRVTKRVEGAAVDGRSHIPMSCNSEPMENWDHGKNAKFCPERKKLN